MIRKTKNIKYKNVELEIDFKLLNKNYIDEIIRKDKNFIDEINEYTKKYIKQNIENLLKNYKELQKYINYDKTLFKIKEIKYSLKPQ